MSLPTSDVARRYTIVAAVGAVLLSPLLALAYFATTDGASSAEEALLAGWIEPTRQLVGPLVTFGSADAVYAIYTLVLALLFPAMVLSALVTRSNSPQPRGAERWGWRLALVGYTLFGAGLVLVALLLVALGPDAGIVDALFLATMMPGLLFSLIGSTVLGIALLRRGYRPRLTAWLLALALPLWFLGSFGFGHNSLGVVPLFIAWAVATRAWANPADSVRGAHRDPSPKRHLVS